MPSFNDNAGHDWLIKFDGISLSDLKDAHGISLQDVGGQSYVDLEMDQSILTKVVCFLCREQAERDGVKQNQLCNLLVGDVAENALQAIWGAAKLFFRPRLWSALRSAYERRMEAAKMLDALLPLLSVLNKPEVPNSVREAAMSQLAMALENMSTNSPQSSESQSAGGQAEIPSKPVIESQEYAESTRAA